jgi:hypothetical protein
VDVNGRILELAVDQLARSSGKDLRITRWTAAGMSDLSIKFEYLAL